MSCIAPLIAPATPSPMNSVSFAIPPASATAVSMPGFTRPAILSRSFPSGRDVCGDASRTSASISRVRRFVSSGPTTRGANVRV